jgi:cold shock CspA family protein
MQTGIIKTVVVDRGFGFIESPGSPDMFFHMRALQDDLAMDETLRGRRVEFEPGIDPRSGKTRAVAVWPAK